MSVRKLGKARWVHDCPYCAEASTVHPDQFRAVEAQQAHARTLEHAVAASVGITTAFVADLMAPYVRAFARMEEGLAAAQLGALRQTHFALG